MNLIAAINALIQWPFSLYIYECFGAYDIHSSLYRPYLHHEKNYPNDHGKQDSDVSGGDGAGRSRR